MYSHARILIVEDERIPAVFLQEILESKGFTVIGICDKGADAITTALALKPDIIFMDIMLKDGISGAEAALKISTEIETKIIFLTAHSDEEMIEYALECGAINYLIKPYREKQILTALQLALNQTKIQKKEQQQYIYLSCEYLFSTYKSQLLKNGKEVALGSKSLRLIRYLCNHIDSTIESEMLSYYVYGEEKHTGALRTLISRLNKLLECELIQNSSRIGYKIEQTSI